MKVSSDDPAHRYKLLYSGLWIKIYPRSGEVLFGVHATNDLPTNIQIALCIKAIVRSYKQPLTFRLYTVFTLDECHA